MTHFGWKPPSNIGRGLPNPLPKPRRWERPEPTIFDPIGAINSIYQIGSDYGYLRPVEAEGLKPVSIATNKSAKMIGAKVVAEDVTTYGNGSVCFLPKPTECDTHEAVEILIDIATGQQRKEFEWMQTIEIPGIRDIESKIGTLNSQVETTNKAVDSLKLQVRELEAYRNVYSVYEDSQVAAVEKILLDLGFKTERTEPGFPVDLLGLEIAVEVTSDSGKIDSESKKMFQLTTFIDKYRKSEKVLLVANTYKREDPKDRHGKESFTGKVVDFFTSRGICVMTSSTLLELWKFSKTERQKARKMILETLGELRL